MNKLYSWQLWDWISIRKFIFGILFIVVGIFSFFEFPDFLHFINNRDKTMQTQGFIITYTPIKTLSQGKTGNHIYTSAYEFKYWYTVNNKNYDGVDVISKSSNDKFLTQIITYRKSNVTVEYNPKKPEESALVIE